MVKLHDILIPGWWTLTDQAEFYPEDLPSDWQLSFFANEFPAVFVPFQTWSRCSQSELLGWREDVHRRFRFYLEAESDQSAGGSGTSIADAEHPMQKAEQALGDQLAAWVLGNPHNDDHESTQVNTAQPDQGCCVLAPRMLAASDVTPQETRPNIGRCLSPPAHFLDDLRAARDWLQQLTETTALVLLPETSATRLHQWWRLVELMGFEVIGHSRFQGGSQVDFTTSQSLDATSHTPDNSPA